MIKKSWFNYLSKYAVAIIIAVVVLSMLSAWASLNVKFSFSFEQFFKSDDPDLALLDEFKSHFGGDDDFVLVAFEADSTVADSSYLALVNDFTKEAKKFNYISKAQSLTNLQIPIKTPFGFTTRKVLHIDQPDRYNDDFAFIASYPYLQNNLINAEKKHLLVILQISESLNLRKARILKNEIEDKIATYPFKDYYTVGRPYFQTELVDMQIRELRMSTAFALFLVCVVFLLIFKKVSVLFIGLSTIGFSFLIFCGYMFVAGRTFSAIASLYPLVLIIVGTSDVIHILSKYLDEQKVTTDHSIALRKTIHEIGKATFYTSITTAVGFLSLMASKITPIKEFGINAAVGVMIAYVVSMLFASSLIYLMKDKLTNVKVKEQQFWSVNMNRLDGFGKANPKVIAIISGIIILISIYGINIISTNYKITSNLPTKSKITRDFMFFEENFSGFRPFEFLVSVKSPYQVEDYNVALAINRIDSFVRERPEVSNVLSPSSPYQLLQRIFYPGSQGSNAFVENEKQFQYLSKWQNQVPYIDLNQYLSKEGNKARISSKIKDIGADSILAESKLVLDWIHENIDSNMMSVAPTGIGMLIDQNAGYVRKNLLRGLLIALLAVSFLMVLLFRDIKMLLIALVPNVIPLLIGGALIGFSGVNLDATISIIFVVIFGIAVDDSIHFLSKFKLCREKGMGIDESLSLTFLECGKPIIITSILLFAGFLILFFSIHPPSVIVGWLISITLLSALLCDLFLLPVLIRWIMKDSNH